MSFVLEISFMGLIAFVPGPQGQGLTAVVPDATYRYFASDGSAVPSHRALLVYQCANVVGGCDPTADQSLSAMSALYQTWDNNFDPTQWGARELKGMDLAVTQQQPVADDIRIGEVPDMTQFVSADTAKLDSNFLQPIASFISPYRDVTASRAMFQGIQARVTQKVMRNGQEVDVNFAPLTSYTTPSTYHTKMSEMTTVSMQVGDSATITFTPFRPNVPTPPPLPLKPMGAAPVQVWVLNLAVCDQWTGVTGSLKICSEDKTHDGSHHFERYYELSQSRPLSVNRPVPVMPPPPSVNANDRPICPPVLFVRP